ncbi:hypothetical protein [Sphingopyxis sp.]|uniref:hypothetical protein n=1 Tax=Sphingopyxis sp. TaxID=1908224 RepID=UPI001DA165ED|nr:hypothetical protein [Sphingopyxis sp.]MBW8295859.1 hypothetical protein [Sphingopyxis sp.]
MARVAGVRRSVLLDADGYSGEVLLENLELVRTIEAAGGRQIGPKRHGGFLPNLVRTRPCRVAAITMQSSAVGNPFRALSLSCKGKERRDTHGKFGPSDMR